MERFLHLFAERKLLHFSGGDHIVFALEIFIEDVLGDTEQFPEDIVEIIVLQEDGDSPKKILSVDCPLPIGMCELVCVRDA